MPDHASIRPRSTLPRLESTRLESTRLAPRRLPGARGGPHGSIPHRSTGRGKRRAGPGWALVVGLGLAAACGAPGSSGDERTPAAERPATGRPSGAPLAAGGVRPTLEEVFLIPGPHGSPPASRELSADGRWLLYTWRELVVEEGERRFEPNPGPRLIATFAPERSGHRGVPLRELLPPAPGEAGDDGEQAPGVRLVHAFFPSGSDLVVATGKRLFLLEPGEDGDPADWTARLALDLEPDEPEAADDPDRADDGAERSGLRSIQSVAFESTGERRLVLSGNGERLAFDPAAPLPWSLDEGRSLTRSFPTGARPRWSDDDSVAFSPRRPLAWLDPRTGEAFEEPAESTQEREEQPEEAPVDEGASDDAEPETADRDGAAAEVADGPETRRPAHVWRRDGDRFVVLEDWEEEGTTSLSPRGEHVLHTRTHDELAPERTLVPDYLTERVSTRNARRQWAEDVAYARTVAVWDLRSGERQALEFPDDEGTWLNTVGWAPNPGPDDPDRPAEGSTPRPERHAWMRVSADHSTMELWVWSPEGLRRLWSEVDPRWYGGPASWPRWTPDGRRLVLGSEATELSLDRGRSQLFAIDADSGAIHQLTRVAGEVDFFRVIPSGGVIFTASDGDPRRRSIGLVTPAAVRGERGSEAPLTLPTPRGWNEAPRLSADGSRLVFSHQTIGQPAELYALDRATGESLQLTRTVPEGYLQIPWIRPVPLRARHPDGTEVSAHVYLPEATALERPDRPRAAVVFIHGAGYLQNVTDSMTEYEVNLMFHSRLARMGYVVVDVDYRGSKGYGGSFRTDVQYQLGRYELEDIHLVLDELAERGVIDAGRVACYGGSYGGFLTLMALFTAPERWVAGAALRSVTDWRTYHPRYTQPRLGRPSTHAEAYERSSPIDLAEGLEDPLLILHGMVDSNVFVQDSIRLIEALIDLGKDFDAMLYPSQGHAFDDGMHWLDEYRRIERFLTDHLGAP